MSNIIEFKLVTPIVIESDLFDNPLRELADTINMEYSMLIDIVKYRKAVRFYESADVDRQVVKFGLGGRKVVSFNTFEVVDIGESDSNPEDKKSKILYGAKAIMCLAFLEHIDVHVVDTIRIPLGLYYKCNHRQWLDISKLTADVMLRNDRLGQLIEFDVPSIILRNEERVLHDLVTFLEKNDSLVRNDETKIRSLNDMNYSLMYGWIKQDDEEDEQPEEVEVEENSEDGADA